jgi:hypothetical protein
VRSLTAALTAALVLLPAAPAWAAGQPPVAVDDTVTYQNSGGLHYIVPALANDSDPDGDPLTYTAVTPATKGDAYLRDGKLFYSPYAGQTGTDTFAYTVSDGQGNTATAKVTATLWIEAGAPRKAAISIPTPGSATLTWLPGDRAVEYQIRRNGVVVGSTTDLTWTDTGLLDTANYEYFIVSVGEEGRVGRWSYNLNRWRQLPTPRDVTVDLTDDPTSLVVNWPPWGTFGPWRIYRDGVPVATSASSDFRDTGLVTGRAYSYQVQLLDSGATTEVWPPSALSGVVEATPSELSPINQLFWDLGSTLGRLGPITVAERAISGGRQQDHRNALILQQDGQEPIVVDRDFATAHTAAGGVTGDLGFPVAERKCPVGVSGCGQMFEGGSIWNSAFSGGTVVRRVIQDGWAAAGWMGGRLGPPMRVEEVLPGGLKQAFLFGAVYWSEATGSHGVSGPIYDRWAAGGYEEGALGYPTRAATCGLRGGGCGQAFQGGWIHWSPATGAQITTGAILATWSRQGAQNGRLGYPTRAATCGLRGGGCGQAFQGGWIHWSPATGAQITTGAILTTWSRQGSQNGRLGYPTAGATVSRGVTRQTFQGGAITVDQRSGRVTVTYR